MLKESMYSLVHEFIVVIEQLTAVGHYDVLLCSGATYLKLTWFELCVPESFKGINTSYQI